MKRVPVAWDATLIVEFWIPLFFGCVVLTVLKLMEVFGAVNPGGAFAVTSRLALTILFISAIGYGIARVGMTHPKPSKTVNEMLKNSPWRWPMPLPLGPVHLMPQDAVAVLLATWWADLLVQSWWPTVAFAGLMLVSYLLSMAGVCRETKAEPAAVAIGFLLTGAVAFIAAPWLAALFLVAGVAVARWGSDESLRQYHEWSEQLDDGQRIPSEWTWDGGTQKSKDTLRWPHSLLNPLSSGPRMPVKNAAIGSLLLGTWICSVCHALADIHVWIPREVLDFSGFDMSPLYRVPVAVGGLVGGVRLLVFLPGVSPPLSLWGRLRTGQIILPGFDRIFAIPVLLALLGFLASGLGWRYEPSLEWFLPVTIAGLFFIAVGCGPTLEEWRLTGKAHLRGPYLSGEKLMVTQ